MKKSIKKNKDKVETENKELDIPNTFISIEEYNLLKEEIEILKDELDRTKCNLIEAEKKQNEYKNEVNRILSSNSWKFTKPIRLFTFSVNKIIYLLKKLFVKFLKLIYVIIPIPREKKSKIMDKLENKFSLVKRIRRSSYNSVEVISSYYKINQVIDFGEELDSTNKRIAIHAHVYYIDLMDEFISYFNNMPYSFDLFVSVANEDNIRIVEEKCKNISKLSHLVVKKCQNVGRDFSPMFVEFGSDLVKYDYVCHIHTKKSVRTGSEQDGWRNYLIGSVLGSSSIIRNIFYQFENDSNLGLVYPETYKDMPYWAHTYLQNRTICSELCQKFNIEMPLEYFDYSVGSIFWAKANALKKLFDLHLTYKDFGVEEGKNDGTFAHAIERTLPSAVMSNGYKYLIIDIEQKVFKSTSDKNLWQYCNQTYDSVKAFALNHDVITFDIFDTLITRNVVDPDKLMDLIGERINRKFHVNFADFKKIRSLAEYNVRVKKNFKNDVNIDEIYEEISKITEFSENQTNKFKEIEKNCEIEFCIPRNEMLRLFNDLKKDKKKIVLISDMYLKSDVITKMLNKCGYEGWDELLLSCEINKRKDNGTMWDYYLKDEVNSVHIGDNETSDIQAVCDRNHHFIHVMQGRKILNTTSYGKYLNNELKSLSTAESIMFGLIYNKKMFNNPFRKDFNLLVVNYKDYGYSFLAPLFIKFFLWLDETVKENKNDGLLFLAREGYYLEQLYKDFCKISGKKEINHDYFLASRRAVSVAAIKSTDDTDVLLDKYYSGSLKNLFKSRFGYKIDCFDQQIELPKDKKVVIDLFEKEKEKYFASISEEQKEYKKYASSIIDKYKKPVVVDLGYSGTIQYYLSKVMNKKIPGYYFVTEKNILPLKINCTVESCFSVKNVSKYEDTLFYNSLILESFLTAPYGQLLKFENGTPVYKDDVISQEEKERLDLIYEGIIEFMKDYFELYPEITDDAISSKLVCKNFYSLIMVDDIIKRSMEDDFVLEDKYCSDETTNVFNMLKSRR